MPTEVTGFVMEKIWRIALVRIATSPPGVHDTKRALIENAVRRHHQGHDPWHVSFIDGGAYDLVKRRLGLGIEGLRGKLPTSDNAEGR